MALVHDYRAVFLPLVQPAEWRGHVDAATAAAGGSRAHRRSPTPGLAIVDHVTVNAHIIEPALGKTAPIAVLSFLNCALADRLLFQQSVEALRNEGVQVLLGRGAFEPHSPRMGQDGMGVGLWNLAIEAIEETARDDSAVAYRVAHMVVDEA